jgi:diacylglycerol O-acyltransferase
VGEGDPEARVAAIHDATIAARNEPAVEATNAITSAFSVLPPSILAGLFGGMLLHVDLVAGNVPGFPETPYVAGARAERWYAFGPTEGSALNVTLMSHGGVCGIGLTTDRAAVIDPDVLLAAMRSGFDEIVALGSVDTAS